MEVLKDLNLKCSDFNTSVLKAYLFPKVRTYKETDFVRLSANLMAISKDLGIRNSPNDAELKNLCGYVARNFGDFTAEEIRKAFDLVISGKIYVDENRVEHYQSFNAKYLGYILGKYRKVRNDAIREMESLIEKNKIEKEIEHMKTDEYKQEMYEGLISQLAEGVVPDTWNFVAVFGHMANNKMLHELNEMKAFADKCREELDEKIKNCKISGSAIQLQMYELFKSNDKAFRKYWRGEWVRKWANDQIECRG